MRSTSIWQKFAPVHRSHDVIGTVTQAAAEQTGLRPGTPVVAGGGDFPVSMLGFGIVGAGITADVYRHQYAAGHAYFPPADRSHHPEPASCRRRLDPVHDPGLRRIEHEMVPRPGQRHGRSRGGLRRTDCDWPSTAPPGSDGLLFYPYMSGERRRENTHVAAATSASR